MRFLRLKQSNHVLLSFFMLVTAFFFITGCVEDGNNQGAASPVAEGGFSVPIPLQLNKIPPGSTLTAFLVIDGGTPIPMTVNGDNVSANTGELSAGKHTFTITYFLNGERVAAATSEAIIIAGENTAIPFDISQVDQDLDKDGVIGIDEVISGTDPDNALSVPQAPDGVIDFPISNVTIKSGESVNFRATVTDPDINTFTFLWDFGGGADNVSLEDPGAIVFKVAGTFFVTFTATDSLGLKDPLPDTRVITVQETNAPTAKISFPPPVSLTDAKQITVRGTATDKTGVSAVLVNGNAANTSDGFAHWQVIVPLNTGDNILLVETRDPLGNTDTNAASASTHRQAVFVSQRSLTLDTENNRALVVDSALEALIAVDLATGNRTILSGGSPLVGNGPAFVVPISVTLDAANNRALVGQVTQGGALSAVDLATGNRTILYRGRAAIGVIAFSPDGVTLDTANNRVLVADGAALTTLDLATGNLSVLSGSFPLVGSGPKIDLALSVTLDAANNRALLGDPFVETLIAVDLATGNRTIFSGGSPRVGSGPRFDFPRSVTLDTANNRVLVLDSALEALIAVDLLTGNRTILSDGSPLVGSGPDFVSSRGITLDATNNRALILDDLLDVVIAVDLLTGNRTILSENLPFVTSGLAFAKPASATLDTANNRALILDSSLAALIAVDLATGNRTIFSDSSPLVGNGPGFSFPRSVTLDTANNRALVTGGNALIAVDLATGNRTVFSDSSLLVGNGPGFSFPRSATLDAANNRALVPGGSALIAVDLSTGNRTILSGGSPTVGNGPAFSRPLSVTLDATNNRALVLDDLLDALISVDLATGNRTVFSDGSPLVGNGPAFVAPESVTLDASNNRALVVVDVFLGGLIAVDLSTGNRTIFSDGSPLVGSGPAFVRPFNVALDATNNRALILDSNLNTVFMVDIENGERVIISR